MLADTPVLTAPRGHMCPCGKANRSELERIHRGFLIKTVFFWLPMRRYKCYKCKRKLLVIDNMHVRKRVEGFRAHPQGLSNNS
jgi:hypothetical protein